MWVVPAGGSFPPAQPWAGSVNPRTDASASSPLEVIAQMCYTFIDMSTTGGDNDCLNLNEVQALNSAGSVIAASAATMSSTFESRSASLCIDGNIEAPSCHSACDENEWLRVDYPVASFLANVNSLRVYNRDVPSAESIARIVGATIYAGCTATNALPTSHAAAEAASYLSDTFDSSQDIYTFASDLQCPSNCPAGSGCNPATQACESCPISKYSEFNNPFPVSTRVLFV